MVYVKRNYQLIFVVAVVQVALACGLAAVGATFIGRSNTARMNPYSPWHLVLRLWAKQGEQVLAMVLLKDGDTFFGQVRGYSTGHELENRELVLGRPLFHQEVGEEELVDFGTDWTHLVIPASSIRYIAVDYWKPAAPNPMGPRTTGRSQAKRTV
jgi:hypothetical protein